MIGELWPGGPLFKYDEDVFRPMTDSVLLAGFVADARLKRKERAVDLGCGSGIISILIALKSPDMHIDGIEIQPHAAELAAENAQLSGLSSRLTIIEGDIRRHRDYLQSGVYDIAVSNPPFHKQNSGKPAANDEIAISRNETSCTLADVCRAACYLTRFGGLFFLAHKPERLADVFGALSNSGFEPKRLRFVQHTYKSPPSLVLIESRRGGKSSLKIEAPFILKNDDGSDTEEARAVYQR